MLQGRDFECPPPKPNRHWAASRLCENHTNEIVEFFFFFFNTIINPNYGFLKIGLVFYYIKDSLKYCRIAVFIIYFWNYIFGEKETTFSVPLRSTLYSYFKHKRHNLWIFILPCIYRLVALRCLKILAWIFFTDVIRAW